LWHKKRKETVEGRASEERQEEGSGRICSGDGDDGHCFSPRVAQKKKRKERMRVMVSGAGCLAVLIQQESLRAARS
jgi:hypothetical protein